MKAKSNLSLLPSQSNQVKISNSTQTTTISLREFEAPNKISEKKKRKKKTLSVDWLINQEEQNTNQDS